MGEENILNIEVHLSKTKHGYAVGFTGPDGVKRGLAVPASNPEEALQLFWDFIPWESFK